MDEEKESNFKITDRRKFNADGSPREQTEEPEAAPSVAISDAEQESVEAKSASNVVSFPGEKKEESTAGQTPSDKAEATRPEPDARGSMAREVTDAAARAYDQASRGRTSQLPAASFLGLVNMLAVEAAMHMGMIETPPGQELPLDLEAARHLIDMLGLVQVKTEGNLTAEEANILDSALAQLRMQFVALSRKQ